MSNQSNYLLFIDEIGEPDLESPKPYILSGCSVEDFRRDEIKNFADHIKYKYFGRTDIVFHSKEIGRAENEFQILENDALREKFEDELLTFLKDSPFKMFVTVLDKKQAQEDGWTTEMGMYKTAGAIFRNFILALKATEGTGNILIEPSYFERDAVYLRAFNFFRSPKSPLMDEFNLDYKEAQQLLTSLSFVTKQNHDIEVQISDLMAYAAWQTVKPFKTSEGTYEKKIAKVLETKLFKIHYKNKIAKTPVYKAIKPLQIVPEQKANTLKTKDHTYQDNDMNFSQKKKPIAPQKVNYPNNKPQAKVVHPQIVHPQQNQITQPQPQSPSKKMNFRRDHQRQQPPKPVQSVQPNVQNQPSSQLATPAQGQVNQPEGAQRRRRFIPRQRKNRPNPNTAPLLSAAQQFPQQEP